MLDKPELLEPDQQPAEKFTVKQVVDQYEAIVERVAEEAEEKFVEIPFDELTETGDAQAAPPLRV